MYIGKGCKFRYEHINNGKSCSYALNKAHFSGVVFNIFILYEGLTEKDALAKECEEIQRMKPEYNLNF